MEVFLWALAVWLLVTFGLPIFSFWRLRQMGRELQAVRDRLAAIEARTGPAAETPRLRAAPEAAAALPVASAERRPATISATPPGPPAGAASATPAGSPPESLETRIGSRWLLYVGILTLLVGVSYFIKYAVDNEWVTETTRVGLAALAGASLVAAGLRFRHRGLGLYGEVVAGGGIALLLLSTYAALSFYRLIGPAVAFSLIAAIAAAGAWLADRERAQGLGIAAVGGGFLNPFLVGGWSSEVVLFGYLAALIAGTTLLAYRRAWPVLHLVSFLFTVEIVGTWLTAHYRGDRYVLVELFLTAFAAMFLYIWRQTSRRPERWAQPVAWVLLTGPALYHLASLIVLAEYRTALLIYFVGLTLLALLVVGPSSGPGLRSLIWAAVVLPFFAWIDLAAGTLPNALALAALLAVYGMHLAVQLFWATAPRLATLEALLIHANGLALLLGGTLILQSGRFDPPAWFGFGLAFWNGALAWVRRGTREAMLHFLLLAAAMFAAGLGQTFSGAWLTIAWAIEAGGLIWFGQHERRRWLRLAGEALLAVSGIRLLVVLAAPVGPGWMPLLNQRLAAGLVVVGVLYFAAWLERRYGTGARPSRTGSGFLVAANVLSLLVLSSELRTYWNERAPGREGYLARETSTSLLWGTYGVALILAGIRWRKPSLRYLAIGLLGATIIKVFAVDLSELERIYRVLSVVMLGLFLLVASYLYQRYRVRMEEPAE